jgi:hypothetical protein
MRTRPLRTGIAVLGGPVHPAPQVRVEGFDWSDSRHQDRHRSGRGLAAIGTALAVRRHRIPHTTSPGRRPAKTKADGGRTPDTRLSAGGATVATLALRRGGRPSPEPASPRRGQPPSLRGTLASRVITHRERSARVTDVIPTSKAAIVVLHSRAGDEHEALALLGDIDPDARSLGLLPLGPFELPPEGRHWYAIEREASPGPCTFSWRSKLSATGSTRRSPSTKSS